jgi:hypothetical protein
VIAIYDNYFNLEDKLNEAHRMKWLNIALFSDNILMQFLHET